MNARKNPGTVVLVAACAVPVMIAGGFALVSVAPLGVVVGGVLRNPELRRQRVLVWPAVATALAFATGLLMWALGPDREQSLTRDLHPALTVTLVAASAATALGALLVRRRTRHI